MFDFPKALAGVCLPLKDGVQKYGRKNWAKGLPTEETLDSLLRHISALQRGEVIDPESKNGATHYDAILANALMLSELRDHPINAR